MASMYKPGGMSDTNDTRRSSAPPKPRPVPSPPPLPTPRANPESAPRSPNLKNDIRSVRSVRGQRVPAVMPDGREFLERITGGMGTTPVPMPEFDPSRFGVNPNTQPAPMPDFDSMMGGRTPLSSLNWLTGAGVRDYGGRNMDPGSDALLRAIMSRMGGQ
jgi:hypothetical protein